MQDVCIVDTGISNTRSLVNALNFLKIKEQCNFRILMFHNIEKKNFGNFTGFLARNFSNQHYS